MRRRNCHNRELLCLVRRNQSITTNGRALAIMGIRESQLQNEEQRGQPLSYKWVADNCRVALHRS